MIVLRSAPLHATSITALTIMSSQKQVKSDSSGVDGRWRLVALAFTSGNRPIVELGIPGGTGGLFLSIGACVAKQSAAAFS